MDVYSDTVWGTADPGDEIEVSVWDPVYCEISVFANEFGDWSADFSECVDIVPGAGGQAKEHDGDGDVTMVDWWLPNEPLIAVCKNIEISAGENGEAYIIPEDIDGGSYDPDGDSITLSVDNLGPFSIGEHYVNLTVRDENGESDTCQAKVTVVETTAPIITKTEELIHGIQDSGIQQGIKNSLVKKLENAKSSIEKGNINAAINKIRAFQNQVQAQKGKKIPVELAEQWIDISKDIIQVLEDL